MSALPSGKNEVRAKADPSATKGIADLGRRGRTFHKKTGDKEMRNKVTNKMVYERVRRRLGTDVGAAQNALLRIYRKQTPMERAFNGQMLLEKNGCGFTALDSQFMSSLAEQKIKRGCLSDRQNQVLLRKMPRYARQICEIVGVDRLRASIERELDLEKHRRDSHEQ